MDDKNREKNITELEVVDIPMIPLRGLSIFPSMVLHFDIGREKSINALEKAMVNDQYVFLTSQMDENVELPTPKDFYKVGTIARIKQMLKLPGDSIRVLVEGICRGVIEEMLFEVPYFKCRVKPVPDAECEEDAESEALMRTVLDSFDKYVSTNKNLPAEAFATVVTIDSPGRMADVIGSHIEIKLEDKQKLLEAFDQKKRLEMLNAMILKEVEILNIEHDISSKVKSQMDKNQREYYLREQIRAIQSELGGAEDIDDEVTSFREQLQKLELSDNIRDKIEKEINRFSKMQPASAEATVSRTYIETVLALPWNTLSEDNMDIVRAEKILNEDHYGLEKVKERVLEYLAVVSLSDSLKGPILCLVGPPGTGKTSIAKSIARSVDRKFARISLGGVRDEAEIRGHRRTYIGAIPGRIINAIKECGTRNPVFLFDEVDKIGADYKGDPASALLEVLDPEQNKEFNDHFLEVPFDLSKVMFITTANTTETIPGPLLDRMEVIEVSGYTEEDKVHIATEYLVPKQIKENGLSKKIISFTEKGIRQIINYYTRESGVRNLEREIGNVCRKVARRYVAGEIEKVSITAKRAEEYLGKKRYHFDVIKDKTDVGVTTGLAWTAVGGVTLFIETSAVPGSGKLVLTGQMGDVMQESAKAGISYIRAMSGKLGIQEDFYEKYDLHIHIPEGATPKDGPSAGVTMCTAVISTLTGIPVRKDVAMTGEITLRGKVLPVGGIREKVMAAHRAGIRKVLIPADNEPDIQDIPEAVRDEMEFVLLNNVEDALEQVLIK